MSKTITTKKGKTITLLNPSEKGKKFAAELRNNTRYTNNNKAKTDKDGVIQSLSDTQRAYRSGYLDARKDSANCYKHLKKKKG